MESSGSPPGGSGQCDSPPTADTHNHPGRAGDSGSGAAAQDDDEEGDGGGGGLQQQEQQQRAEALQRDAAMATLGVGREHRLTVLEPLPRALVLSTRLCLLSPGETYCLAARLLAGHLRPPSPRDLREGGEGRPGPSCDGGEPKGSLAAGSPRGGLAASPTEQLNSKKRPRPPGEGSPERSVDGVAATAMPSSDGPPATLLSTSCLPDSAMHIVPRRRQDDGGTRPEALTPLGPPLRTTASLPYLNDPLLGSVDSFPGGELHWGDLQALTYVQQQLEARLHAMVSERQARRILQLPPTLGCGGGSSEGLPLLPDDDDEGRGCGSSTAAALPLPGHAGLALAYVRGQRRILLGSLRALRGRISAIVIGMHRHILPSSPPLSRVDGRESSSAVTNVANATVFDVLPAQCATSTAPNTAPVAAAAVIFGVSTTRHMGQYSAWAAEMVALGWQQSSSHAADGEALAPNSVPCGLKEIICRPKRDALLRAGMPPAITVASNPSGPGGAGGSAVAKRRPLASVTLRSIRNHGGGGNSGGGGLVTTAAAAASVVSPAASPPPETPTLPAGISAALGLDMAVAHDPVMWGAMTTKELKPGAIILEVSPADLWGWGEGCLSNQSSTVMDY